MRISFDVDDTLICGPEVPTEQHVPWWRRYWYPERLRHGTRQLIRELHARRHTLWIYTTSYRGPRYLRRWFRSFGVPLEGVVNQDIHDRVIKRSQYPFYPPSKYPPAFGIDLHIDDSEGVAIEGERFQFRVLVISPNDQDWVTRILKAVS
ncbi:MAG TPA: hypothetical protein VEL76_37705 [Gemmataceae bacterium]|nr:hypothetical protein [Gemmataceae bacterium]